jgi:hypothetical protein
MSLMNNSHPISASGLETSVQTKGASSIDVKAAKLREVGKMIRGL